MSRNHAPLSAAHLEIKLTPAQQAQRMSYSDLPNIRGIDAAVEFIKDRFGIEVTTHYLWRAKAQGRLARHEICHVIHFSERDLYDFIVLGTRKVSA